MLLVVTVTTELLEMIPDVDRYVLIALVTTEVKEESLVTVEVLLEMP